MGCKAPPQLSKGAAQPDSLQQLWLDTAIVLRAPSAGLHPPLAKRPLMPPAQTAWEAELRTLWGWGGGEGVGQAGLLEVLPDSLAALAAPGPGGLAKRVTRTPGIELISS